MSDEYNDLISEEVMYRPMTDIESKEIDTIYIKHTSQAGKKNSFTIEGITVTVCFTENDETVEERLKQYLMYIEEI